MLNAMNQSAVAVLVYNNKTMTELDDVYVEEDGLPIAIPGLLIGNKDGMMLLSWLEEELRISKDRSDPKFFNRVRINMTTTKKMSVIWEVVLVVVVILLAVSLAISGTWNDRTGCLLFYCSPLCWTLSRPLLRPFSPPCFFPCCVSKWLCAHALCGVPFHTSLDLHLI
jgi:hypothetical protein